eukprot:3678217-Rhodomonas_salina.2
MRLEWPFAPLPDSKRTRAALGPHPLALTLPDSLPPSSGAPLRREGGALKGGEGEERAGSHGRHGVGVDGEEAARLAGVGLEGEAAVLQAKVVEHQPVPGPQLKAVRVRPPRTLDLRHHLLRERRPISR